MLKAITNGMAAKFKLTSMTVYMYVVCMGYGNARDEKYPVASDFSNDINLKQLWVAENQETKEILGFSGYLLAFK